MKQLPQPPQLPARDRIIQFRVSQQEWRTFQTQAVTHGMRLSQWIRAVLLQKLGLEPKI